MIISFIKPENQRIFLGLITALAFFVQSLLPTGYMPQFNAGKFFEITICHGDDITKVVVDEHMNPASAAGGSENGQGKLGGHLKSCPYAAVSSKNLMLVAFLYRYTEKLTYERMVERILPLSVRSFFYPPYEGRAPPYSLA